MTRRDAKHDDERWAFWLSALENARQEIVGLHFTRYVWKNLVAMLQASEDRVAHNGVVNGYLRETYSHTVAVGIRRQAQNHEDRPKTLGQVLYELATYPHVFTVERALASMDDDAAEDTRREYESRLRRDLSDGELAPDVVQADSDWLRHEVEPVKYYVDKALAHSDRKVDRHAISTSFDDIEKALGALRQMFVKYYAAMTGAHYLHMTPEVGLEWLQMFDSKWRWDEFKAIDPMNLG